MSSVLWATLLPGAPKPAGVSESPLHTSYPDAPAAKMDSDPKGPGSAEVVSDLRPLEGIQGGSLAPAYHPGQRVVNPALVSTTAAAGFAELSQRYTTTGYHAEVGAREGFGPDSHAWSVGMTPIPTETGFGPRYFESDAAGVAENARTTPQEGAMGAASYDDVGAAVSQATYAVRSRVDADLLNAYMNARR